MREIEIKLSLTPSEIEAARRMFNRMSDQQRPTDIIRNRMIEKVRKAVTFAEKMAAENERCVR